MSSGEQLIRITASDGPARVGSDGMSKTSAPASFVAGPENRLAAFACTVNAPIASIGNPVLLYGPPGSGKSVLAAVLAQRQTAFDSAGRILSEPASDFARRFREAVDADDIDRFRRRYQRASVWVLEDLHRLSTRSSAQAAAQEELMARIEMRLDHGLPLIATTLRLPTEHRGIRGGLASRLLPGLTIPLRYPQREARRELLRLLAEARHYELSAASLEVLEESLPPDLSVRQLTAAIEKIRLKEAVENKTATAGQIRQTARSISAATTPTIATVAKAVAKRVKLKTSELQGPSRRQAIARSRALAMHICREMTDASLQEIGAYFGGRDHSTVLHAVRSIEESLNKQGELRRIRDEVVDALRPG